MSHGNFTHIGRCCLLLLISGEAGVLQRSSEPDRLEKMMSKDMLGSVREADAIMTEWRSIVTSIGDTAHMHEVHRALSYGDMSLAAYVMGISLTGEDLQKYKCKESLAHDVVVILQGIVQVPLTSPWAAHQVKPPAAPAGSSQPAARQSIMRELAADGSVKDSADLLKEAGFETGQHVRRKADQEYGEILSVEKGRVRLKQAGGDVVRVSMDGFLGGEWSVFTPKPEPHVIEDVFQYFPTESPEYHKQKMLAELYLDMHELFEKHAQNPHLCKLRLLLKPRKAVEVTGAIPKQKLCLCPASLQIKHSSKKPEDAMFQIGTPMADCYFWVQPYMQLPKAEGDPGFLNPAFLVQGVTDSDLEGLNMEVIHVKSTRNKGVLLPLLRNMHALQQGDTLLMHKQGKSVDVEPLKQDVTPPKTLHSRKRPLDAP